MRSRKNGPSLYGGRKKTYEREEEEGGKSILKYGLKVQHFFFPYTL
jgi:hypothetical protein